MQRIAILSVFLFIALISHKEGIAQSDTALLTDSNYAAFDTIDFAITDYDKYTPILGGKEFRLRNGNKVNGMLKDFYPDSTLKHKGYYTQGQLVTTYKNYFPDGKLERSFVLSGTSKLTIQSYYPNGKAKEYIEYRKGEIVKYVDYYPNGKIASIEEHDKKKGLYTVYKTFYRSGKIKTSLELVDKKKWAYYQKEYYPSGKIKEEGPVLYNKAYYDYQKEGSWKVYNEDGSLKETQEFYQGELIL